MFSRCCCCWVLQQPAPLAACQKQGQVPDALYGCLHLSVVPFNTGMLAAPGAALHRCPHGALHEPYFGMWLASNAQLRELWRIHSGTMMMIGYTVCQPISAVYRRKPLAA